LSKEKRGPKAEDLYVAVLNDLGGNVLMMSDTKLTSKAANIWQKLFKNGFVIKVYDNENPGADFHTLHNLDEWHEFFGDNASFKKYQFILSTPKFVAETRSFFNMRRIRELSPLGAED